MKARASERRNDFDKSFEPKARASERRNNSDKKFWTESTCLRTSTAFLARWKRKADALTEWSFMKPQAKFRSTETSLELSFTIVQYFIILWVSEVSPPVKSRVKLHSSQHFEHPDDPLKTGSHLLLEIVAQRRSEPVYQRALIQEKQCTYLQYVPTGTVLDIRQTRSSVDPLSHRVPHDYKRN